MRRVAAALLLLSCGKSSDDPASKPVEPEELPGPDAEVAASTVKAALPEAPSFDLPKYEGDIHDVREVRVRPQGFLRRYIRVNGYITWIYDCNKAVAAQKPALSAAEVQKAIDEDATLCEVPKFYLGVTADAPPGSVLWVTNVPRPPTKAEKASLDKEDLADWPTVPKIKVGDYITVTGMFDYSSPRGESNTDGLLVYSSLVEATPGTTTATLDPPKPLPAVTPMQPLPKKSVDPQKREDSIKRANECARDESQKHYEDAITSCRSAVDAWKSNHRAWYTLGSIHATQKEWSQAADEFEHAARLLPSNAMYQLMWGNALYEAAVKEATDKAAAGYSYRRPSDPKVVDLSVVNFDDALLALRRAILIEPKLWRAHYYAGRIYRDRDRPKDAVAELTAAVQANAKEDAAYVALIELYRRWGFTDQAIGVAKAATSTANTADTWFELGLAYDDKRDDDKAIEAYGKALAIKKDDVRSRLARGQAYARKGSYKEARTDLDEVVKSRDATLVAVASRALMDIAAKAH